VAVAQGTASDVRTESDAGTSRLTWWIVRQDGREPILGLALWLTSECCGGEVLWALCLIIWNGSSPAPGATETSRRLAVRAGIGADPLRDLHQRADQSQIASKSGFSTRNSPRPSSA
jgi:hypothetical protein